MPNTELDCQLDEMGVGLKDAGHSYQKLAPTLANAMLYLLCLVRPPQRIFRRLLERAWPYRTDQPSYPKLHAILRLLWTLRRSAHHLWFMGFVNVPGALAYALYRIGIVDIWRRLRELLNPREIKRDPKQPSPTPIGKSVPSSSA